MCRCACGMFTNESKVISLCKFYALGFIKQTLTPYTHVTLHVTLQVTPTLHNNL